MYSSERFLSYGQTYLKEKIDQKALEEIQAMKRAELDQIKELEKINYLRTRKFEEINKELKRKLEEIENEIQLFKEHIVVLRENKEFESEDKSFLNEHIIQLREQISSLEMQRNKILEEYHYNKERIFKNRMKGKNNE